jgi:hypothetical protein
MAPRPRRSRAPALLLVAGLLLVAVLGLAWFVVGDDDPADQAAGASATTAAPAAGSDGAAATTAPGPTTAEGADAAGDPAAGGDTDASGPPAPPAPACQRVISDTEAAAALGAAVARAESRDGFLVRSCTFWSSNDRYLLVQVSRGVAASRDQYDLSRLPADKNVPGIGQAARWTRDTGLLDVFDGAARFQVGLFTEAGAPAAAEPPPRLEAAARAIAARL